MATARKGNTFPHSFELSYENFVKELMLFVYLKKSLCNQIQIINIAEKYYN